MLKRTQIAKTLDELEYTVSSCFSSKVTPVSVTIKPFVVRCQEAETILYKIVEEVRCEDAIKRHISCNNDCSSLR